MSAAATHASLRVENLGVSFGGVRAVNGVSFEAGGSTLVGVIGPNGAGKTTMFDAICGFVRHTGRVLVGGQDLRVASPQARARAGIGRSFQDARLFPSLTTRETVTLAMQRHLEDPGLVAQLTRWPTAIHDERALAKAVGDALADFGLTGYADKFISELSTGGRRIVELASVYVQEPEVILLDEPSAGIAQREVEALGDVITRLRTMTGATILMVEHDIPLVRRVADRVIVLDLGELIADGAVGEVLDRPEVIAGYLGTTTAAVERSGKASGAAVKRSGKAAAASVTEVTPEVAAAPEAPAKPPPGLPANDDFRVPLRASFSGGGLAAALVALVAFSAGPLPLGPHRAGPRVAEASPSPAVLPSPSPAPEASPSPFAEPSPPLVEPAPLPSFEPSPAPTPSPTTRPSPSPSPSPSNRVCLPPPVGICIPP